MITEPIQARAKIVWLTPEEGGRSSGPPDCEHYAPTVRFRVGPVFDDTCEHHSVVIDLSSDPDYPKTAGLHFLVVENVLAHLRIGAGFAVMEGRRRVADGTILATLPS